MNNRLRLLLVTLGALIVLAIYTYPLWQGRFTTTEAVADTPAWVSDALKPAYRALTPEQQKAFAELAAADSDLALALLQAANQPDVIVPETEQATPDMIDPVEVASGEFTQLDLLRQASGTVTMYQLPDNRRVLRFDTFRSTKAPDLRVILTHAPDPRTPEEVGADYIDLGPLQGNVGSQNYNIPAQIDLNQYQGVVIYSLALNLVISTAQLT